MLLFVAACGNTNDEAGNNNSPTNPDISTNTGSENNMNEKENAQHTDKQNNSNKTNNQNNKVKEVAENQEDMKSLMGELPFYEIDVEVSYGHDKEFEIEIEHHSNGDVQAEFEDELNGEKISDDLEAFNYIYPKVKNLNISKEMDKQTIINEVLKTFDLADDYKKIEIEFEFDDGTELSFEIKNK